MANTNAEIEQIEIEDDDEEVEQYEEVEEDEEEEEDDCALDVSDPHALPTTAFPKKASQFIFRDLQRVEVEPTVKLVSKVEI